MPRLHKEISFWLLMILMISGLMALGYVAHADEINCSKAVANQTGIAGQGRYEVCIEIPNRLRNASNRAVVESSICEEGYGCHPIDQEGNIDQSKWWSYNSTHGVLA